MTDVAAAPSQDQQVPLDTIPISPTGGSGDSNEKSSASETTAEGDVRTVFHDPENFNVKHPLMNTWTLWFTKPPSGKVCRSVNRVSCRLS
jgi:translation initiation factor 4E